MLLAHNYQNICKFLNTNKDKYRQIFNLLQPKASNLVNSTNSYKIVKKKIGVQILPKLLSVKYILLSHLSFHDIFFSLF